MRRRRHLPRASGGASAAPSRAALFPAARIWDPRTALGRERRAQGPADLGGPRRADPALVYRGDCRTTARAVRSCPARLIAPVDVVSAVDGAGGVGCSLRPRRPSHLEGSVTHWPKSSNRRREFISRTRRLRRLIRRELFRRLIRELFRRSREFRSSSDHGTGAIVDGPPCRRAVKTPREPFRAAGASGPRTWPGQGLAGALGDQVALDLGEQREERGHDLRLDVALALDSDVLLERHEGDAGLGEGVEDGGTGCRICRPGEGAAVTTWADVERALSGLPGWRRVGVEWHGPCPVTGAGHDCCWCGPGASTAIRIGLPALRRAARRCGRSGTSSGPGG